MNVILLTPFTTKERQGEAINKITDFGGSGNLVAIKSVIVYKKQLEKHFDFLPERQRQDLIAEWGGSTIKALLVKNLPTGKKRKEIGEMAYVSTPERAERDIKLWFPEYADEI